MNALSQDQMLFHIREMELDDLDQVQTIDQLSFTMPWPKSAFRYELLENPRSLLWVAEVELPTGQRLVVGAIVVWFILDEAHIATLSVHPEYRQRGIGRKLLARALLEAMK